MIKNILLTGSGGFIGKNLKSYLEEKFHLFCPRSFELDLCDTDAVKEYFSNKSIDFIIHCASIGGARGLQDKDTTIKDNLAMINNLISAKKEETRIILFGSGAMYGKDRDLIKIKENEIGNYIPKDLYGQSKLEISKIIKQKNDILMLNIFACYGYGEKETRFPSYAINQILKNENIIINQNCIFDYLWVEDMERIVKYFIENNFKDKIINITPTKSISLLEIAEIVNNFTNNKVKIKINNKELNYQYTGDNSLLLNNYSNCKFTSINEGLKKLFEYNKNIFKEKERVLL